MLICERMALSEEILMIAGLSRPAVCAQVCVGGG